jgi:hypothetical protein
MDIFWAFCFEGAREWTVSIHLWLAHDKTVVKNPLDEGLKRTHDCGCSK